MAGSQALRTWKDRQLKQLDELESAHKKVGGIKPGRRYTTQQIDDAYVVLLCAQFQQYCRDLHSEAASWLVVQVNPASMRLPVAALLTSNRLLDRLNAQPSSIGSDFGRFGMDFWKSVRRLDKRNEGRQTKLDQVNIWRNAIAHQDFVLEKREKDIVKSTRRTLPYIRGWRRACEALAPEFDEAVRRHLQSLIGASPW